MAPNVNSVKHRLPALLIGFGLWLAGNSLLTTAPANGQEVAGNYPGCIDQNADSGVKSNCGWIYPPGQPGQCGGDCTRTIDKYSICDPTVQGNSPCPPPPSQRQTQYRQDIYQGYCHKYFNGQPYGVSCVCGDVPFKRTALVNGSNCHYYLPV